MAYNSDTITGTWSGNASSNDFGCRIEWAVTNQDPATLTSTVSLRWIATRKAQQQTTYRNNNSWSRSVDSGTATTGTSNFNLQSVSAGQDYLFLDQIIYVTHTANVQKTISLYCTYAIPGTSVGTMTFSGQCNLGTIATSPPTISSFSYSDVGTGYSTVSAYVAGYTKFRLSASASAVSPSTLSKYSFYNGSTLLGTVNTSSGSATYTYSSANASGTYTFKVTVTDNNGNSTTRTLSSVTVSPYSPPTISNVSTFRCNSSGTADGSGAYARCQMTYSVASVGNNAVQTHTVKVGSLSATNINSNSPITVGGSLSASSTYSVVYTVSDKFTTSTITQTIPTEFINFDLYPDSTTGGMGVGMTAESGLASFNMPVKPYKGIRVTTYFSPASVDAINSQILSTFASMSQQTVAWIEGNPTTSLGSPFNTGGVIIIQIEKSVAAYGQVVARSYTTVPGCFEWRTSIYNNALTGWSRTTPFRIETLTASSYTVASGAVGNVTISAALSGFVPKAVIGVYGNGSSGLAISDCFINSEGNVAIWFSNPTSASKTVTWKVQVLYT